MKTFMIRLAIVLSGAGLLSSGALAHEEYSETGFYHRLSHLNDQSAQDASRVQRQMADDQQRGAMGPIRTGAASDSGKDSHRSLERKLGGIGGTFTH